MTGRYFCPVQSDGTLSAALFCALVAWFLGGESSLSLARTRVLFVLRAVRKSYQPFPEDKGDSKTHFPIERWTCHGPFVSRHLDRA